MNLSDIELPSNKKFGFFFSFIFTVVSIYFYLVNIPEGAYVFAFFAMVFLTITLLKSELLQPLNKLWMCFGLFLGMIVSPVVLGVIFFAVFTPIAFLMRLSGRDELRLKFRKQPSHWIRRETESHSEHFKNQF